MRTFLANKKPPLILAIVVVGALWAGLIFWGVGPLERNIQGLAGQIQKNNAELAKINAEIENYQILSAALKEISAEKESLRAVFPEREEMAALVKGVEGAAERAGVSLAVVITDEREKRAGGLRVESAPPVVADLKQTEQIPYSLEVAGSYRGLLEFVTLLENLPFFTEFTNFKITAIAAQNEALHQSVNTGAGSMTLNGVFFIRGLSAK